MRLEREKVRGCWWWVGALNLGKMMLRNNKPAAVCVCKRVCVGIVIVLDLHPWLSRVGLVLWNTFVQFVACFKIIIRKLSVWKLFSFRWTLSVSSCLPVCLSLYPISIEANGESSTICIPQAPMLCYYFIFISRSNRLLNCELVGLLRSARSTRNERLLHK